MATPLFSQQTNPNRLGFADSIPGALISFKAGRLFRDGETNWVRPDVRKGVCFLKKEDDGLMRFCWKDRQTNEVEEELIVFSGDTSFEQVTQAASERVYVLKFKSSSQRLFFWMQDPNSDTDAVLAHNLNVFLSMDEDMDDAEPMDSDSDVRMLLGHPVGSTELHRQPQMVRRNSREAEVLSHHREQSALASEHAEPHTGALPTAQVGGVPGGNLRRASRDGDITSVGGVGPNELSDLRQLLSGIRVPESYATGASSLRLGDVLTPQNLAAVLGDERLRRALFPQLPDNIPHTAESLDQVIRSPQFQQALSSLTYALESGQIAPLVHQLGLGPEASTSVEAFLQAIQRQADEEDEGEDEDL
ncbi:adhesion regulating molecule [Linderina pennispora]|uniref:Adhesion regulating molecule n=1 Tax=Linderina pennispora TaxID=61395 RepID=A0A1Y1W7N5_9FUNG|nr:adhesion regulating molecule [Linderina pennispora]ORX69395.1 adhesion regulating molecule [Linderina pennispora]